MEDWAEIRRLHRSERMPLRAIARKLGVGRNTVRRALASDGPPRYRRPAKGSIVDAVEPQVRALLAEFPDMPATVIAERIGWDRSLTVLKDRVRVLRPLFVPPDPSSRTTYRPGELAQCEFPAGRRAAGRRPGRPAAGAGHGQRLLALVDNDDVDFGPSSPASLLVRLASGSSSSGTVEFRLDSRTGPAVASVPVSNTGGWQSWTSKTVSLSASATGKHRLYAVFTGPGGDFVNLNWFQFL